MEHNMYEIWVDFRLVGTLKKKYEQLQRLFFHVFEVKKKFLKTGLLYNDFAYIHTIDKMMLELQYTYYSRLSILLYHKCTKLLSKPNSTVLSNWKLQKKAYGFRRKRHKNTN